MGMTQLAVNDEDKTNASVGLSATWLLVAWLTACSYEVDCSLTHGMTIDLIIALCDWTDAATGIGCKGAGLGIEPN